MGAEKVVISSRSSLADEVGAWTDGYGVDAAVVCTGTQSNAPIEQAAEALRDRGRLVDVGITKIELPWKIFYEKELEVRFSRSYGPGRYDPAYEWAGEDYPIGYVRWTEQRNFQAALQLMAEGRIDLGAITTRRIPFTSALGVYQDLLGDSARDIGVVLEYESATTAAPIPTPPQASPIVPHLEKARISAPVDCVDVIGAGNFARTMLLPHLRDKISFGIVVNQTALSANHVKSKFGFREAATNINAVFADEAALAVLIATRHHLHAPLVLKALQADRHVFVEKPLCLTRAELQQIDSALAASKGSLQVGFNRRFAPASVELKRFLDDRPGPKAITYRVVPGKLNPAHWYGNYAESGGRVLGEACHFLDYFYFLAGSKPVRVFAQTTWPPRGRLPFPDSVAAQVEFADGSCGQLIYSAESDSSFPKETLTVFSAGAVAEITNFQQLLIHHRRKSQKFSCSSKGHAEQMAAWAGFLRGERDHPLPYEQSRTSMLLTFAVLDSIQQARAVEVP